MKTAVSIPDRVFREAENFARVQGRTLDDVYQDALEQYLLLHAPESITKAVNKVRVATEPAEVDFVRTAARRVLRRETW